MKPLLSNSKSIPQMLHATVESARLQCYVIECFLRYQKARQKYESCHAARNPTSKKREAKNSKFGFGGRKRLKKQNDASSAANMDSYKGRGKVGKGSNRPGKARRAAARTK